MLKLTVRVGGVVEVGDVAAIKVFERKGQSVCLGFVTALPITLNPTGIIPERFAAGIYREPGERRSPALAAAAG